MTQQQIKTQSNPAGTNALRLDVVAGLTAAAVVLPKAMAYATVAGLPVAVGLYTAFIPMLVYALLGSSRVLSVSSTTTLAILAGTQLGLVVPDLALAGQCGRCTAGRGADVLRPLSPEHPDDETFEGLLILRPDGRLFSVNAQNVAEQIDALVTQDRPRVLALDMSRVSDIEYSALQAADNHSPQ